MFNKVHLILFWFYFFEQGIGTWAHYLIPQVFFIQMEDEIVAHEVQFSAWLARYKVDVLYN